MYVISKRVFIIHTRMKCEWNNNDKDVIQAEARSEKAILSTIIYLQE